MIRYGSMITIILTQMYYTSQYFAKLKIIFNPPQISKIK
jgi:hypothetical protein